MSAHEAEMVMMRERAERAEAEVERLQNMRDSIGMKLTAAEARVRELEGIAKKWEESARHWREEARKAQAPSSWDDDF